jgi:O-antigen/teichoic acid export membrane protein
MKPALCSEPPAEATAVQPGYPPGVRADSSVSGPPIAYRRSIDEKQRQTGATGDTSGAGIARNAFYLVVGQAITTALAIVLSAALGRSLGPRDFGSYYLITTMSAFAYVFAEWGQPYFVIRQVAREPLRSGDLLGTALVLRVVFTLIVATPAGLIAWALGYGARTTGLAVFLILAGLPLFLAQGYGMVFRARDKMGRDATVSITNKAVALCATLLALALAQGIPGVILAQAVAGVAGLAVAGKLYGRMGTPPLRVSRETARELLGAGPPLLAMAAAVSVQPYLDAIILSKMAPVAAVGWYGAAKNILGVLTAPAMILGAAAYPRIARASVDATALRQEVRSAFRPLLWLGALAGTGTYLFAGTAIDFIYGSRGFEPAAMILKVFAPGLFLLFIDILLGNIVYASGSAAGLAVAKVASVVVGTALDFLLIPLFQQRFGNGGIGIVVAFALSEFVVFAGAMIVLRGGTLELSTALNAVRSLAAGGATVLLFQLLPPVLPFVGVPLCVVVFTAASVALGLVDGRDLDLLRALVRQRTAVAAPAADGGQ